jgi:hypothetical protein
MQNSIVIRNLINLIDIDVTKLSKVFRYRYRKLMS